MPVALVSFGSRVRRTNLHLQSFCLSARWRDSHGGGKSRNVPFPHIGDKDKECIAGLLINCIPFLKIKTGLKVLLFEGVRLATVRAWLLAEKMYQRNAAQVWLPTVPSTWRLNFDWKSLTALSVFAPKLVNFDSVSAEEQVQLALQVFHPTVRTLIALAKGRLPGPRRGIEIRFRLRGGFWTGNRLYAWGWTGFWGRPLWSTRECKDNRHVFIALSNLGDRLEPSRLRICLALRGVLFRFGVVPFHPPNSRHRGTHFPRNKSFAILVFAIRCLFEGKRSGAAWRNCVRRKCFVVATLFAKPSSARVMGKLVLFSIVIGS